MPGPGKKPGHEPVQCVMLFFRRIQQYFTGLVRHKFTYHLIQLPDLWLLVRRRPSDDKVSYGRIASVS